MLLVSPVAELSDALPYVGISRAVSQLVLIGPHRATRARGAREAFDGPCASVALTAMTTPEERSKEYLGALLRDPDFLLVLDADFAAEERGEIDPGLNREEFLAKYGHLLNPPPE